MEIKQIQDQNYAKTWDNFIIANSSPTSFLQSWEWGKFKSKTQNSINKAQGKENLFRYAIYNDNNELITTAQFIKIALPGKKFYLNCPKGPIVSKQYTINSKQLFELLENKIKEIAGEEKIVFFRIAPPCPHLNTEIPLRGITRRVTQKHLNTPKILVHLKEPEKTLVLDLQHTENDLLKNMHPKTRYNIRLAERKGVRIRQGSIEDIDTFYNLLKETAQRDKINIFEKDYYNKLLITNYPSSAKATAGRQLLITLFIAEYNTTPLAAILVIGFGDTATYLHGASSNSYRELMPNYLIQWRAIKWAQEQGYRYYDFWGISEDKKDWAGITRFKKGFVSEKTGREIKSVGTFDFILDKLWYNLYRLGKLIKF